MPGLRYKRWQHMSALQPHVAHCASGHTYLWDGTLAGVVEVPWRQDVEELLNPLGDRQSDFEVAWEKYGVMFDAQGKEVLPVVAEPLSSKKK